MISTAVIMAAGMGTRFGQFTEMIPKGFVEFGGIPMVERSIQTLIDSGIKKIIIGTVHRLILRYLPIFKTSPRI